MSGRINEQAMSSLMRAEDLVARRAEKQDALLQPKRRVGAPQTTHLAYKPDHIADPAMRRQAATNSTFKAPELRTIQEAFERRYRGEKK